MAEVVLENISKRFGRTHAISDLSLTIADGEFVVLLGPTGAGKTTTLRLVAGLEAPDNGRLLIGGNDMTRAPIADHDVAFVFQQYSLYPHYSVYDNLAFPLRSPLRRWSSDAIRQKVNTIAKLLRIDSKLNNKATQLSGGEMQRVAIGRALVREPSIFLMDEPLSSLDAKLREDLRIELKRIQVDLGATILYVTHDQIEALTLADRIGVLAEGKLVQVGTPRQIYTRPANIYVAQRLGSPPINLLPAGSLGTGADTPAAAEQIGIRPEDLMIGNGGATPAQVIQIEHLGAETVAVLQLGDRQLHALTEPGVRLTAGEQIRVSARRDAALYFDRSGQRLEQH
jgi:multiple sugar transport system ATP-binding protein